MNAYNTSTLIRVSKTRARKLWGLGQTISFCPHKLRPDGPWRPNIDVFPERQAEVPFDKMVQEFERYNCQTNEVGYYTAFYLRKPTE